MMASFERPVGVGYNFAANGCILIVFFVPNAVVVTFVAIMDVRSVIIRHDEVRIVGVGDL